MHVNLNLYTLRFFVDPGKINDDYKDHFLW